MQLLTALCVQAPIFMVSWLLPRQMSKASGYLPSMLKQHQKYDQLCPLMPLGRAYGIKGLMCMYYGVKGFFYL